MDALDLVEQQHRELEGMLDQIRNEPSAGRKTALVVELVRMLDAHVRTEQRYTYALCAEHMGASRSRLYDAYETHALAVHAAENLLSTRATDVRFEARLRLLRELVLRHAHEEEDFMLPQLKRKLTDEELEALGNEMIRAHALFAEMNRTSHVTTARRTGRGASRPVLRHTRTRVYRLLGTAQAPLATPRPGR